MQSRAAAAFVPHSARAASHWHKLLDLAKTDQVPPTSSSSDTQQQEPTFSEFRTKIEDAARALTDAESPPIQPPSFQLPTSSSPSLGYAIQSIDNAHRWVSTLREDASLRDQQIATRKAFRALGKAFRELKATQEEISRSRVSGENLPSSAQKDQKEPLVKSKPKKPRNTKAKTHDAPPVASIKKGRKKETKEHGTDSEMSMEMVKRFSTPLKMDMSWLSTESLSTKSHSIETVPKPEEVTQYSRRVEGVLPHSESPVLEDVRPVPNNQIAQLAHGLDKALFNPNVHWFQDPHSKVFNFKPEIQRIPSVTEFAFDRVTGFVPSSRDEELANLARQHGKRFTGSTSSLSGMLTHIYYLISGHKPPDISPLSNAFHRLPMKSRFSGGTCIPARVTFHKSTVNENGYALDNSSFRDSDGKNVLAYLGTMLEKYLTLPPSEFNTLLKDAEPSDTSGIRREAYRYAKSSKFVMRSQLDCYHPQLPGSGIFDIKTRACIAIRRDMLNWENNSGYQITRSHGLFESFEREYFDLIRSAFMKYQFQARIGNMDGVLVAFHNTEKFFGFQYIPLSEMDARLFGNSLSGERVFGKCVGLLEALSEEIVSCYPDQSVTCLVECLHPRGQMNIWVHPESAGMINGSGPISLITVTAKSFSNGSKVESAAAVSSSMPWDVHYKISHSALPQSTILTLYNKATERMNMAWYLPEGMTLSEFLPKWEALNYGSDEVLPAPELDVIAETDAENVEVVATEPPTRQWPRFIPASKSIKHLRKLARRGRSDSEGEEAEPQVVDTEGSSSGKEPST